MWSLLFDAAALNAALGALLLALAHLLWHWIRCRSQETSGLVSFPLSNLPPLLSALVRIQDVSSGVE